MPFGIEHPPTYTSIAVYMCGGGLKGPKSSNGIQLSRFVQSYGIFSDFVVPTWFPSSSRHPCCPHIILVIPTSSPSSSHHPHSPQKVPMWSPWSVVSMVSTCCPRCPHIVSTSSPSSPSSSHCPHSPQKVPMWSPWSVVSMVSSCCCHHPHRPHVVLMSSRRSPHHPQPPRYPSHPPPNPLGSGGPQISKNAIRFELIEIF